MSTSLINLAGKALVKGQASGKILACHTELSFWGGVDPVTGEVIDRHHSLSGEFLKGKILALPGGRGSCSGSGVILEMIVNGKGPDAIVVSRPDDIITLGIWIAKEIFKRSIPLVMLDQQSFVTLSEQQYAAISYGKIQCADQTLSTPQKQEESSDKLERWNDISLSDYDRRLLDGEQTQAAQVAMKIILHMAQLAGATKLIDVNQVHIDGCIYTGQASLGFAKKLLNLGGQFAVPTSLNAISVDYRRWKAQGVASEFGEQASALADTYVAMGAKSTFTCAPYLLGSAPKKGEQIAWAESNAVVFANSILGARTMKYPDFLDACIALTGRAPFAGAHVNHQRKATLQVSLTDASQVDDLFYPVLGYHIGKLVGDQIPVVLGLAELTPSLDDLKAFSAAFGTTSSAPMFHILGITPDAKTLEETLADHQPIETISLTCGDLLESWKALSTINQLPSDLISLGNPHFSLGEFKSLARLCLGHKIKSKLTMYITAGREVVAQAEEAGYIAEIERFGAKIITDTCWCMIAEPIIASDTRVICTNSAKYAHYGPGMTGRKFKLLSLYGCVQEAITGTPFTIIPEWIS